MHVASTAQPSPVSAVLAKVRAVVPPQFLKASDCIHRHKNILHNVLLNNLPLHESLSGGAGDGASDLPPTAIDRARTAAEAVRLMQRTAAMSGLSRAFVGRASLRSRNGRSGAVNRLANPLAAYFGAPGCERHEGPIARSNKSLPTLCCAATARYPSMQAERLQCWSSRRNSRPANLGAPSCALIR